MGANKSKFLFIILLGLGFTSKAQKEKEYFHPKYDSIINLHKSIAILPFDVALNFRPVERNQLSESDLQSLQKQEGTMVQKTLDAFLFKKKLKKDFKIDIQEIDSTNRILKKSRWQIDTSIQKSMKEVASFLKVDALLYGVFNTNRPVSKEVATAFWNVTRFALLPNITGYCTIYLYDGKSGELLWKFKRNFAGGPNVNIDAFFEPLMKTVCRRLQYE